MSSLPASGDSFISTVIEIVVVHNNKCAHDLKKKNKFIGFKRTKHGNGSSNINNPTLMNLNDNERKGNKNLKLII